MIVFFLFNRRVQEGAVLPIFFVMNDYMELSYLSTYLRLIHECSKAKLQNIRAAFLVLYRSICLCNTHTHTYRPFERGPHHWLFHLAVYDSFLVVGCPCVSWCIKPSALVTHVHIPESLQKLNSLTDFSCSFCWWIQSTMEHRDFLLWHELY